MRARCGCECALQVEGLSVSDGYARAVTLYLVYWQPQHVLNSYGKRYRKVDYKPQITMETPESLLQLFPCV